MAKMFYSLEEAAEKLGKTHQEMQQLADSGQLQQFRDRDKVMFKVDQVDAMAASTGTASSASPDDSVIPLAGDTASGDTDAIDLIALDDTTDTAPSPSPPADNTGSATGISVFDADEVDAADPMAQTVVSEGGLGDDDLTLESVGSGSGLLDLTRESDDTSLGAELLEEIYPGGGESIAGASGAGFSGIFDEVGVDSAPSSAADIEGTPAGELSPMAAAAAAEPYDGAFSGMTSGFMIGALVALLVAMIIVFNELFGGGVVSQLATTFSGNIMMYGGGLLGVVVLLGVVGMFVGKAMDK